MMAGVRPHAPVAIVGYSYRMPGGILTDANFRRLMSERDVVREPIRDRYGRRYRPVGRPVRWPSPSAVLRRSLDWLRDHRELWPYRIPGSRLDCDNLVPGRSVRARIRCPLRRGLPRPEAGGTQAARADRDRPETGAYDPRRAFAEELLDAAGIIDTFNGVHHFDVNEPEEDLGLLRMGFSAWGATVRFHLPDFARWLGGKDMAESYAFHRRVVRNHTHQRRGRTTRPSPAIGRSCRAVAGGRR